MTRTSARAALFPVATLAVLSLLAGCRVNVDKDQNGQDKKVQIDTPFGGIHVNTDKTTALDVGLPLYPGAQPVLDKDHKSVDVHMGFGNFEMRVRAVTYASPDDQDKVLAYYKKALGNYGNVITCRNHQPIGTPETTAEGLSCAEDKDHGSGHGDLELKAGSRRHQHIVSFDAPENGQTRFALVWLDLPDSPNAHGQSD